MGSVTETVSNVSKLVRRTIGAALSGVHAGESKVVSKQPGTSATATVKITSSAFGDGQPIPDKHTPQGANVSPELSWTGAPATTKELVLIIEDPDAPFPSPFVHWILHRLPPTTTALPEGLPGDRSLHALGGAAQGMNDAKTRGYFGPQPPLGHGVHHYHFQLFALDDSLGLGPDATLAELKKAMDGHVLADGELVGTYEMTMDKQ